MKGFAISITILLVVYQASSSPIDEAHGRETRAAFNGDFISSTCIGPYCQYSNGPSIVTSQCSGGNCKRWVCTGGVCKEELRRFLDVTTTNTIHKRSVGDYCPNCGIPSYPQLRSACPGGNCARLACPGGNCARSACPGGNCLGWACPGGNCDEELRRFLDVTTTNTIHKRSVGDYCPNCGIPSYPQLRSACPGGNCARLACPGGNCARSACPGGNCLGWACAGGNCDEELRRFLDVTTTNTIHKRSVGDYCPNCGIPSYPHLRSACPGGNCARSACPGGNCARLACPGGNCARSACPGGNCITASKRFLDFHITNIHKRSADRQDDMDNITHTTP